LETRIIGALENKITNNSAKELWIGEVFLGVRKKERKKERKRERERERESARKNENKMKKREIL